MREYIGAASGAALGYIHGNWRGAKIGWDLGRYYSKKNLPKDLSIMPKRRRTSSSSNSTSIPYVSPPSSRRYSIARRRSSTPTPIRPYSTSRRRSVSFSRVGSSVGSSRAVRVGKRKVGRKLVKKRKVKVSSLLRKKIHQVIDGSKPVGFFKETHFGFIDMDANSAALGYGVYGALNLIQTMNRQFVYGYTTNDRWSMQHFTFNEILDAASVLFFNKIGTLKALGATPQANAQNSEDRHLVWPINYENTVAHGLLDTKFRVIASNVTYTFTNNNKRTLKIRLYKCSPKQLKPYRDSNVPAIQDWHDALLYENQGTNLTSDVLQQVWPGGVTRIGIAGINTQSGVPGMTLCTNRIGHTINELGFSPTQSPMFRGQWKTGYETFTLEPGQTLKKVIRGPKNVMFSAQQWCLNKQSAAIPGTTEALVQQYAQLKPGWSESHILVIEPELLPDGNGNAARFGDIDVLLDRFKFGLAVECTKSFTLEMPETTGTIFSAVGVVDGAAATITNKALPNLNRKRSYYYNTWSYDTNIPSESSVQRVDEEGITLQSLD